MDNKEQDSTTPEENSESGPVSRDSSISRYNALKHGLRGSRTVLPGESKEEYKALAKSLCHQFNPKGTYEYFLVKRIADKMWELERITGLKAGVQVNGQYRDLVENELRLLQRYETSAERSMIRSRRELSQIQNEREKVKKNADSSSHNNNGDDENNNLFIFGEDNGPQPKHQYSQGEIAVTNLIKIATRKMRNSSSGNSGQAVDRHIEKLADTGLALEEEDAAEINKQSSGQGHQPIQNNDKANTSSKSKKHSKKKKKKHSGKK